MVMRSHVSKLVLLITIFGMSACIPKYATHYHKTYAGYGKPREEVAWIIVGYPIIPLSVDGKRIPTEILARNGRCADIIEVDPGGHFIEVGYFTGQEKAKGGIILQNSFEKGMLYTINYSKKGSSWKAWLQKLGPWKLVSPDGKRTIYLDKYTVQNRARFRYVVEQGAEKIYYDVMVFTDNYPSFSPDGKRVAFFSKTGSKFNIVVDGIARQYDGIATVVSQQYYVNSQCFLWSSDSERVLYITQKGRKYLIVVDGKEGKYYDTVYIDGLQFSKDNRNYVYLAKNNQKEFVVVNEIEGTHYDGIKGDTIKFSRFSKRVIYEAQTQGKWEYVTFDIPD
ncbi:TolB family protein [candidate division CSSED10-310 bacterium]|uniref:TolB family protein n=1 Tax=candidate division CSSED10-310 bacterium TaxID=2855610 RepID=A0ABV6YYI5_UNCC1